MKELFDTLPTSDRMQAALDSVEFGPWFETRSKPEHLRLLSWLADSKVDWKSDGKRVAIGRKK